MLTLGVDKLKLKAAASSMHQFCPFVRTLFPGHPTDDVIEASTVFLYRNLAREVFGRRFVEKLNEQLREKYRHGPPIEIDLRVQRIENRLELMRREASENGNGHGTLHDQFTAHVRCVIRSLLAESGQEFDNPELVKLIFPRFEDTVRRLKDHLLGIKNQARFVMKK
jgi:hypothetical protein